MAELTATAPQSRQKLLARRRAASLCTGGARLAQVLAAQGITHVYGIGGNPIDPMFAAFADAGVRLIGTRSQQGACLMSAAHNFVAGKLSSVVLVSSGPAASNCATGVLFAHDNCWPLMVISGRLPSSESQPGAFQDFDAAGFHAPLLQAHALVERPADIDEALGRLLPACSALRPGPVWLDVTAAAISGALQSHGLVPATFVGAKQLFAVSTDRQIDAALDALRQAARPVLLIGPDLRWSAPWVELRALLDTHHIPFAAAPMARGFLPDSHALCFTAQRAAVLAQADLVLMAGAELDWTCRHGVEIAHDATLIRINPGMGRTGAWSGAHFDLHGSPDWLLKRIADGLEPHAGHGDQTLNGHWLLEILAAKPAERASEPAGFQNGMLPTECMLEELLPALPDDVITVLDGNVTMTRAQQILRSEHPVSRLTPGQNGTMGIGVPFAIGAQLACPDRPVVLLSGDFAFGLNALEIETAARHQIPLIAVIGNNYGIGGALRQQAALGLAYPEQVMQYGRGVRYDRLAESLGAHGTRITQPGQLTEQVHHQLAARLTACIDVPTRDDEAPVAAI